MPVLPVLPALPVLPVVDVLAVLSLLLDGCIGFNSCNNCLGCFGCIDYICCICSIGCISCTGILREHIIKGHSKTKHALILRKAIEERIAKKKIISRDNSSSVEDMMVSAGSNWQCKVCAKVLKDTTQVNRHMRTHF